VATEQKYAISTSAQSGYLAVYPDLVAFCDAIGPNYPDGNGLSVQDHKVIAEIYPDANPHTVTFDMRGKWKNGAEGTDNLLLLIAAPGHKYDYATDTGAKWAANINNYIHRDDASDSVLYVEDLAFDQIAESTLFPHFGKAVGTIIRVDRCVSIQGANGGSRFKGIVDYDLTFSVKNTLIVGTSTGNYIIQATAENCTIVNQLGEESGAYPVRRCGTLNVCIFDGDGSSSICFANPQFDGNCASSDGSANTVPNMPSSAFKDYAGEDYHPADGGDLHNAGSVTTAILDLDGLPWADGDQNIGCFSTSGGAVEPSAKPNPLFFGQDF